MHYSDARLNALRKLFEHDTDSAHAIFHKNYHKSTKDFYGLKNAITVKDLNSIFPRKEKLPKEEAISLGLQLWSSNWFEEQVAGLLLIERVVKDFTPKDLNVLKQIAGESEGWATLDFMSTGLLGILAMNYGDEIYPKVRTWSKSDHLWTRRASILIHVLPARKKQLRAEYALPTFSELLHEKEFFIRKAIGWTLREICKHYPEITYEFLKEHRDQTSGLTMREGARRLPSVMRKELLGK